MTPGKTGTETHSVPCISIPEFESGLESGIRSDARYLSYSRNISIFIAVFAPFSTL